MTSGPNDLAAFVGCVPNGYCVATDLVAAGQPTAEQFAEFAARGFKTVLDTRGPMEPRGCDEPAVVEAAGLAYISLPMTPTHINDDLFDRFRNLMNDDTNRPMLVHCQSANRVGALFIPYFMLDQGQEQETALQNAVKAGLRSQEYAQVALEYVDRMRA